MHEGNLLCLNQQQKWTIEYQQWLFKNKDLINTVIDKSESINDLCCSTKLWLLVDNMSYMENLIFIQKQNT